MSEALLRIENLSFCYDRKSKWSLDLAEFSIAKRETVFLKGPSGSGKSTLLNLISGVLKAKQGELYFEETAYSQLPWYRKDRFRADNIGYLFQQFNLLPYLSAYENVRLGLFWGAKKETKISQGERIESLLSALEISPSLWRQPVMSLSVGQRQRVAAARALVKKPKLIIADEPTSALDSDLCDSFLNLLIQECKSFEASLLFVSHDQRLSRYFDRKEDLISLQQMGVKKS